MRVIAPSPIRLAGAHLAASVGMVLLLAVPGTVGANGFAVRTQSAAVSAGAFSGSTAGAEDASSTFSNPAALMFLTTDELVAVGTGLHLGIDFKHGSASTLDFGSPVGSVPIGGRARTGAAPDAFVPALYGTWSLTPKLKLGVSSTSPFGLVTDYPSDWVGRYHALRSEIATITLNPVVAYRVTDWLSVGAGIQLQYIRTELTQAIDVGSIAFASTGGALGTPTGNDGFSRLKADDWGVGLNLGVVVTPRPGTRLGLAYRSHVQHRLDGDANFTVDAVGAALNAATTTANGRGLFADTGIRAALETPEIVSLGLHQQLTPAWAVSGEVAWTHWRRFDRLVVTFDNPDQPDDVTRTDWHDSWFLGLGVTYQPTERWLLRLGVAYEQTPVPDRTREPRVPDADQWRVAVGASVRPYAWLTLNASYSHVFFDGASLQLTTDGEGNRFRGNLSGAYSSQVDILALQVTIRF